MTTAFGDDRPCTEHRVTIPHHCEPGRLLLSLEYVGQTFQLSTKSSISRHFASLANGDVICAGVPLSRNVSFMVECRLGLLAWTELIHVTVAEKQDILVSLTQPYFEGHIVENAPPNSVIGGLQNISVYVNNFQGRVLADVDAGLVESKVVGLRQEEIRSQTTLRVKFSIVSGPEYMFALADTGTGSVALTTLVELDYERQSQYLLTVVATVPGLASTASARVRVYVQNINDNAPQMSRKEYVFQLDDVVAPEGGVTSMRVAAFDTDDDQLTYSIDDEVEGVSIDPNTGEIYIRPESMEPRFYVFRVLAYDGLHRSDPSWVTIQLGRNDQGSDKQVGLYISVGLQSFRHPRLCPSSANV